MVMLIMMMKMTKMTSATTMMIHDDVDVFDNDDETYLDDNGYDNDSGGVYGYHQGGNGAFG